MRRYVLLFCFGLLSVKLFAEFNPPAGTTYLDAYSSARLLGSHDSVAAMNGPMSYLVNPAFGASTELPGYDLSYIGLIGSGAEPEAIGYRGHLLDAAALLPTRIGVVGTWLVAHHSTLSNASLGTGFAVGAGLSKEALPNTSVGASLRFALAAQPANSVSVSSGGERFDWGLTANLGVLLAVPDGPFPNLRWGVVFSGLGKGVGSGAAFDYTDGDTRVVVTGFPPPFTLSAGIAASLIDVRRFTWDVSTDLSFPSFQDVELGLSMRFDIADVLELGIGTSYSLRELLPGVSPERRSFFPGLYLGAVFDLDGDRSSRETSAAGSSARPWRITPTLAFAPTAADVYSFGVGGSAIRGIPDTTGPVIEVDYPGYRVMSPADATYGLSIPVSISDERVVAAYEYVIFDSVGNEIRRIGESIERFSGDVSAAGVIANLAYVRRSLEVPPRIVWDGMSQGTLPPDGEYSLIVSALDDLGNRTVSGPFRFAIDATPPSAEIVLPEPDARVFSPNNDGIKDTITIGQSGSVEALWRGEVRRGDFVVKTFTWRDSAPSDIVWDGKGTAGNVLADGTYRYVLSSTDEAGNRFQITSDPFVLNAQQTPIVIGIDRSHFSPNGDGVKDTVVATLDVPVQTGIVSWRADIIDRDGRIRRAFAGGMPVPGEIVFDGTSDNGAVLPEGAYHLKFSIEYENGNNPSEVSPLFEIDVTAPQAVVNADHTLFSPNGDGNKDIITFFQDTSPEDVWVGTIATAAGAEVYSKSWRVVADRRFSWDGHAKNGLLVPNGLYRYQLSSVDRAGNRGASAEIEFQVDYGETAVLITREHDAFSPNADGSLDEQVFTVVVDVEEGIESYELRILEETGRVVRRIAERGRPAERIVWQGVTDSGSRVSDGRYYAELSILYANGNRPSARTRVFVVDTEQPFVSVGADVSLFSPNRDGNRDTVTFTSRSSSETLWEGTIRSAEGREIRRIYWPGTTTSYVWNGTDEAGNLVSDGIYYLEISTTDSAGNHASARTGPVTLDNRLTSIFIVADRKQFSPNGDGVDDTVTLTLSTLVREGISSWTVALRTSSGTVVRSFSGTARVPERIVWDGRDSQGRLREGEFTARYSVVYEKGDSPMVESLPFVIDVSAPELTILSAPTPFSPDGDGVDDLLAFTIGVTDASEIGEWSLVISDPRGETFRTYGGSGRPPRSLYWDGTSDSGDLVQSAEDYSFIMNVGDVLGNRSRASGVIPVDILVIADGDQLKIRITNITFEPDSPTLQATNDAISAKNNWVLARLTEVLKKYSAYSVTIEGHAVSVYWDDPEQAKVEQEEELVPLSKARAETVKAALAARGIDPGRISTIGVGGADPVVPHGDEENRWQNRRVEFILHR